MPLKLNKQFQRVFFLSIKIVVLVTVFLLLDQKIENNATLFEDVASGLKSTIETNYFSLTIVVVLMFVNWSLEAVKWRFLIRNQVSISFSQALQGVLSGLTLSFVTPHGIGDYFGRLLSVKSSNKKPLVGALFLGRSAQMLATLLFGLVGLSYYYSIIWVFFGLATIAAIVLLIYTILSLTKKVEALTPFLQLINSYQLTDLLSIILLALMRYLVFSLQFVVILFIWISDMPLLLGFAGTTFIFLIKSALPTFNFLSDLGIREYAAILFFENFQIDIVPVLSASLILWMINILTPTFIGIPFMLRLKWKTS